MDFTREAQQTPRLIIGLCGRLFKILPNPRAKRGASRTVAAKSTLAGPRTPSNSAQLANLLSAFTIAVRDSGVLSVPPA
ncbi:MAG: hypothetical protein LBD86_01685 [Spirochaetaceae bacterium]|nr:hypothetical protein [Spirochaetaceae bacterium]